MGDVDYFSVTPNGQYLFCAVSRPAFFLSSMERLVEVCHQLQEQPSNQFLQAWRPACDASPVRPAWRGCGTRDEMWLA